jgi:hypothetical protein
MLKGRFPWLRSIRVMITEEKRSLKYILDLLTVILHNLLIDLKEQDKKEWIDDDDFSEVDDSDRVPTLSPMDVINQSIGNNAAKDERRRRLCYYFEEHFYF